MSYSPILMAHIFAGTIGLLSGTAAMFLRKGSPRHVLAGKVFVASMLTMAVLAVYLAIVRHQPNNIGGGILTFYLIGTGWLTAKRKDGVTSRFDWVVLLIPLALGTLTWMNGLKVVSSGASSQDGVPVGMIFFMGSVMLLAGGGTFACCYAVVFLEQSASRGISGACALGCSSQQGLFSWDPRTAHCDCFQ
jgi:hypothetical protein